MKEKVKHYAHLILSVTKDRETKGKFINLILP